MEDTSPLLHAPAARSTQRGAFVLAGIAITLFVAVASSAVGTHASGVQRLDATPPADGSGTATTTVITTSGGSPPDSSSAGIDPNDSSSSVSGADAADSSDTSDSASTAAQSVDVFYFRATNTESSTNISSVASASDGAASVVLGTYDTKIAIFDSPRDVHVQRLDISGAAGATIELYPARVSSRGLYLNEGAAYIYHDAAKLVLTDVETGATTSMAYSSEPLAWVSQGACLRLTLELDAAKTSASLLVISSGALSWDASDDASVCLSDATVLVGDDAIANNPATYEFVNEDNCVDASFGTHSWVSDYSWIDEPVGSLGAHYHTRGALYYVLYGPGAKFNEKMNVTSENPHNDTLGAGELRFVNAGVYYGPEEVVGGESATYLSSIHEVRVSSFRHRWSHDDDDTSIATACR